jgi:hypothetical protein
MTGSYGVYLLNNVNNNTFYRNRISSLAIGIFINGTGQTASQTTRFNTFTNDTILPCSAGCAGNYNDIVLTGNATDIIFLNVSLNKSRVAIIPRDLGVPTEKNNLTVQWYLTINVTNSTNNNGVEGAQVNINDSLANNIGNFTTDASGYATTVIVTEFTMNGSLGSAWTADNDSCYQLKLTLTTENLTCFTPYNISVNKTGYNAASRSADVNRSKFVNISITITAAADTTAPVVNTSFNVTSANALVDSVINFSGNMTDDTGLLSANWTFNLSSGLVKLNYTLSGTSATLSNSTALACVETCVINFTLYATDTSNNVKQNSTLITIADRTSPIANTSLNKSLTSIFQNDPINLTANATDAGSLSFCQFIENQSLPNGAKQYINKTITGTKDQCSQNYTIALAAGNVINFTVVVNDTNNNKRTNDTIITVVASNTAPVIRLNNASGFAVDPISGSSSIILISFNVTDDQGVGDINASKAIVNLTLGARSVAQFRFNISDDGTREFGTCYNHTSGNIVVINCTIIMRYYDNASSNWVVNISVQDLSGAIGRNDTNTFTYNSLAAFSLTAKSASESTNLNFTTAFLNDQNIPAKAPLLLNNTGNSDFDQINITAALLYGVTTASETIDPSNFFVNVTNNTAGNGLALSTVPVVVRGVDDNANATLFHGPGISGDSVPYIGTGDFTTKGNLSLLFFVDVPSSGLSAQTYNNTWNMTVVDLS